MATFGETLKRERELRKISLREVSEATKIGLRYLEALEGNRFDQLPGGLFNKGFIRAYAKFIGLDGEPLVNAYLYDVARRQPDSSTQTRTSGVALEDVLKHLPEPTAASPSNTFPAKRVLVGTAVAIVVVGGAWIVISKNPARLHPAASRAADPSPAPTQEAGLLRPPPDPAVAELKQAPAYTAAPAPPDPPSVVAQEPSDSQEAPPPTELGLFIGTSETTGIVLLCDGVERVRRDLVAGETVAVSCTGEILLSAGNAGALSLKVNGRECLPLGALGAALEDFPLNAERAAEICPAEKGGA